MLRFSFIIGYTIILLFVIAVMAVKVIAVLGNGTLGGLASSIEDSIFSPGRAVVIISIMAFFVTAWSIFLTILARRAPEWERRWVKTLLIGCAFMSVFFLFLTTIGLTAYFIPGIIGEAAKKLSGIMCSPVFMELGFFFMGVVLLIVFNTIKRIKDGDEFVYLETVDAPEVKENLPKSKQSAVFKEAPLPFNEDIAIQIATIEGALDMEDTEQAFQLLMELPKEVIETPEVQQLRQRLIQLKEKLNR